MRDALGQISTENCKTKNKTKMSCSNRSLWELVGKYLTFVSLHSVRLIYHWRQLRGCGGVWRKVAVKMLE